MTRNKLWFYLNQIQSFLANIKYPNFFKVKYTDLISGFKSSNSRLAQIGDNTLACSIVLAFTSAAVISCWETSMGCIYVGNFSCTSRLASPGPLLAVQRKEWQCLASCACSLQLNAHCLYFLSLHLFLFLRAHKSSKKAILTTKSALVEWVKSCRYYQLFLIHTTYIYIYTYTHTYHMVPPHNIHSWLVLIFLVSVLIQRLGLPHVWYMHVYMYTHTYIVHIST